jgi:hypothetical protein
MDQGVAVGGAQQHGKATSQIENRALGLAHLCSPVGGSGRRDVAWGGQRTPAPHSTEGKDAGFSGRTNDEGEHAVG